MTKTDIELINTKEIKSIILTQLRLRRDFLSLEDLNQVLKIIFKNPTDKEIVEQLGFYKW